jgi:hypothetical protein
MKAVAHRINKHSKKKILASAVICRVRRKEEFGIPPLGHTVPAGRTRDNLYVDPDKPGLHWERSIWG